MSTEDSLIRVVRVDQLLIVGSYDGMTSRLASPRVIGQQQQPAGPPKMVFMELIGLPKEITVPNMAVTWEPTDEGLIKAYRQNVSGLVLASAVPKNVIGIGGRVQ